MSRLEQRPDLVVDRLSGFAAPASPRLQAAAELLMVCASLLRNDEDVAEAALRRFLATTSLHAVVSSVVLVPAEYRETLWEFVERIGISAALLERLRRMPAPFTITVARPALTPREVEVLEQLHATSSLSEVAATLHVSANTVKSQVRTLYRKLGVSHRDDALRTAYRQGLLKKPSS